MKLTVVWREGMHFCSQTESGNLMCDESSEVGLAYPSAPELLMASLGSCIGSALVFYAERHAIPLEGMAIDLDLELAENPHRIGEIGVTIRVPAKLPEEQLAVLRRVADTCLIHATLTHPPRVTTRLLPPG